ncbi:segregation and condensation protein A [Microaceticoccus formicicus]|uniref:segregation and condensation protein A n=1 Tax=Microaceticoccus formicicus TaxID=3118105 RepID=UPI003CD01E2B|nr:segregation/condensation protein A [Peptoniphilaceae bacterium AMB_02]
MIEVNIEKYEGPMDLLLKLIEKNKINIYDIPIKEITEQYINHIEKISTDAKNIAEFIVMASTLLEIKSKLLIPNLDDEEEESDPRDELVQRLIEYKKVKLISTFLKDLQEKSSLQLSKLREESIRTETININLEEDINILKDVFTELLKRSSFKDDEIIFDQEIINRDEYVIEDYISKITKLVRKSKKISLSSLIKSDSCKQEVITIFIAILELVRQNRIKADQNKDEISLRYVEYEDE